MLITDVRAHHIRIPYDAGVANFKQGASADFGARDGHRRSLDR